MPAPAIYWYPDPRGTLETIDFGDVGENELSDIQEFPGAEVRDARGGDQTQRRTFLGETFRVRIILERFGPVGQSSLERDLAALQVHLDRGGRIGFSGDHAKTWAVMPAGAPSRGDATIYTPTPPFSAWSSSGAIAAGDEVVIEQGNPDPKREIQLVDTTTSARITLDRGLRWTFSAPPVVRWRDFYPVLRRPKDQVGRPLVSHDHRVNFTLDMTLEYSAVEARRFWAAGSSRPSALGLGRPGAERGSVLGVPLRGPDDLNGYTLDDLAVSVGPQFRDVTDGGTLRPNQWRRY